MRPALITGVTGQDGFHLTNQLLSEGKRVIGITSGTDTKRVRKFRALFPQCELILGDFNSSVFMNSILEKHFPSEIFNLAAVSSVAKSIEFPELTLEINYRSVVRILDILASKGRYSQTKFYQASSSEMFGSNSGEPLNEYSEINPISPYGEAKALAHMHCREARNSCDLFISNGILFNHEGEFRQPGFVSNKIIEGAISITQNPGYVLTLGNLEAERDWGYAGDYTRAISMMMKQDFSGEYVIATGTKRSVRDFLTTAFRILDLEDQIESNVRIDPKLLRKQDIQVSVGDSQKANFELGWRPEVSFEQMIRIIVEAKLKETTL